MTPSVLAKKLIYFQIILSMVERLLIQEIPALGLLEYIPDIINVLLFVILVYHLIQKRCCDKRAKLVIKMVLFLLVYDGIRFFITKTNPLLFIWGVRNEYRFLLLLISAMIFWTVDDYEKLFKILYYFLIINLFVITIQLYMGHGRDSLGGTFGTGENVNAITNVFLCILVVYSVAWNINNRIPRGKVYFILLGSVYWAAGAELKIFFVELFIIMAVMFFIVKGHSMGKLRIAFAIVVFFAIGAVALFVMFPEQVVYILNPRYMYWYFRNVTGHGGLGRATAIRTISKVFFDNDPILKLFGVGTGNAEFLQIGSVSITSDIYDQFKRYAYFGYFHAYTYVSRGLFGLVWYLLLIVVSFRENNKISRSSSLARYRYFSSIFLVLIIVLAIKDSTLRISVSGYFSFMMMALPYVTRNRAIASHKMNKKSVL